MLLEKFLVGLSIPKNIIYDVIGFTFFKRQYVLLLIEKYPVSFKLDPNNYYY